MNEHKVYFIGAGPGDPEFLTLKGARALERCQLVFVPTPYEQTFADLLGGKTLLVPFDYYFEELLEHIRAGLETASVAFLVPGDLTFYSPFQGLIDTLGAAAEVIPGVGTANAASARLKKTLDLPGVCKSAVIVSPRTLGDRPEDPKLIDFARPGTSLLIYMNNIPLPNLVEELRRGYQSDVPIAIIHRLCLPGEEIVLGTLDDIVAKVGDRDFFNLRAKTKRPALTLVLVGESLAEEEDGTWWNYRRDNIWRYRDGD
ncbi:SAM-dependent methyltransferase [Geoalkalibacter halelectricus]|uniref:SAM-dependent methyltransferase n=1 Tax=Geoalkalibacter halelectricus TaxID=2847045 RepID=UPI003D1D68DE